MARQGHVDDVAQTEDGPVIFKRRPVDLVASEVEALEARAKLIEMVEDHFSRMVIDSANRTIAANGWCAPSEVIYGFHDKSWLETERVK